jgi:hypothetical protein
MHDLQFSIECSAKLCAVAICDCGVIWMHLLDEDL